MRPGFKMGRLDHVHVRVPDRAEADRWYADNLGFEPVDSFDFWGNIYELNCYDYERVRAALVETDEVEPVRYWPPELHANQLDSVERT